MIEEVVGTIADLGDIPDLSGVVDTTAEPLSDGWYAGTILEQRAFTDQSGSDRVFTTEDTPAQSSDSRNIRLQLELKRQSDGRVINNSMLVNYRPDDLTQETVQRVMAETEKIKGTSEKRVDFRAFMSLRRIGTLQRIAGVRQLQRNGNGGLDLAPLYNKKAYFKLGEDSRNPQFKEVKDFQDKAPKRIL